MVIIWIWDPYICFCWCNTFLSHVCLGWTSVKQRHDKVLCSKTQHSVFGKSRTSDPSVPSTCITLYHCTTPLLKNSRVRCRIHRSHSTPCKKAEFEHLQFFQDIAWTFFSACEWQELSFTYQKSEKTSTYLDNLVFSAPSVLWGTVKKFRLKSDRRHTLPRECAGESVTK